MDIGAVAVSREPHAALRGLTVGGSIDVLCELPKDVSQLILAQRAAVEDDELAVEAGGQLPATLAQRLLSEQLVVFD